MAGNLLSFLLLVFPKLGSSSMGQLLAYHWEKARKEICMHAVRCTASLLFSNQVLLPQSHSPSARQASRRGDVSTQRACTTCSMSSSIVGQKASEKGCRLRHRWWERESDFLKHFCLLVEWRLRIRKVNPPPWSPVITPRFSAGFWSKQPASNRFLHKKE